MSGHSRDTSFDRCTNLSYQNLSTNEVMHIHFTQPSHSLESTGTECRFLLLATFVLFKMMSHQFFSLLVHSFCGNQKSYAYKTFDSTFSLMSCKQDHDSDGFIIQSLQFYFIMKVNRK